LNCRSHHRTAISAAVAIALTGGAAQAQGQTRTRGIIEEITVTATKRAESMQDIPVSVQAMTGENIRNLGVSNFDEYVEFLPNVVKAGNAPGMNEIYIRGAATAQSSITVSSVQGSAPAVALYLDEQPISFGARNLDVYAVDLERIEVLPGPQGTLFGSSSQSGTVRLITNKPDPSAFKAGFQTDFSGTSGGEAGTAVTAYMNMPLSEKLAVRVAAYADSQGGWIDNIPTEYASDIEVINRNQIFGAYICEGSANDPAACNGQRADMSKSVANNSNLTEDNFNDATYRGARVGLGWDINDNWSLLLQHTGQTLETEGVFEYDPQFGTESVGRFVPVENQDKFGLTTWTVEGRIAMLDVIYTGGYLDRDVDSITDYTAYTHGGGYQVYYMCIGGYTSNDQCFDPTKQYKELTQNTRLTNELRVTTDADNRWRATAGVFVDDGETNSQGEFQYFGAIDAGFDVSSAPGTLNGVPVRGVNNPNGRGPATIFVNDFTRKDDQIAVFGEFSFDITETFTASLGARWYDLDFNLGGSTGSSFGCKGGPPDCDGTGFDNRVSIRHETLGRYNETGDESVLLDFFSQGNADAIVSGVQSGTFNISGLGSDGTANQSDTIIRASLDWRLSDDVMVFGTWSEGFRPQTTNRNAAALSGNQSGVYQGYMVPAVAKTDELTNWELGIKSDLLGGSLRLNATAYFSKITELQTTRFDPANVAFLVFIENVGDAEIKGLDADLSWAATDRLTINAAFSLVNSELTRINPQLEGVSVPVGSELPYTAGFSGNLRARYDFPLPAFGGDGYVAGSIAYTGERRAGIVGDAYFAEDVTRRVYGVSRTGIDIAAEGGNFGNEIDPSTGQPFLNGRFIMDPYTLLNLSFGVVKDYWGAELYVHNVTDENAMININTQDYHPRVGTNRPRTAGLRLFFDFE